MFTLAALAFVLNNFMPFIPVILWYLISINIFTFFVFTIDKFYSLKKRNRVPEMSLHFFSIAGGFVGALLSMVITKHKIHKKQFLTIQGIIMILWIICIFYVISNLELIQKTLEGLSS
jgi:uncharacterized membrane protein YsdA (DUF1294 family)